MALSKKELLLGGVSDQQALVKKLQERKAIPPKKRLIPGGKKILELVGQDIMEEAVYNWLRGCNAFSQVTISFAKDPDKYQHTVTKVKEFDARQPREIWETHPTGKKYLAEQLADIINSERALKITAKKDGVWLYKDASGTFAPYRQVTEEDVRAQEQLVEEVIQEMKDNGEDPSTLQYDKLVIGDSVPTEDWEPYVEFIPKRKQEYGK